jgi:mannitol-specific phosphotransferase system IIBC component
MRVDAHIVTQQIAALLLTYPELAEDEILRADTIEAETEAHDLLRKIEQARQDATAMAGAVATLIAGLELRLGRFERREKAMRELAFKIMQVANLKRIELAEATLSTINGQQRVVITDESLIPDILCRFKKEPDKTKIKEALKAGNKVLGAVLSNAEPHLMIRTK